MTTACQQAARSHRILWHADVHVGTIDPLPGWEPGNPAAIYVAALRATR